MCNQDDILVSGVDAEENLEIVGEVLERLQKYNVRLNLSNMINLRLNLSKYDKKIVFYNYSRI